MKNLILQLLLFVAFIPAYAQIGYQVSLLDNATGEPRANERVEVKVKLLDSNDNVIVSETKRVTTNDLGVLSLSVGDDSTFEGFDWNNLPLFISATVDGVLIGKSQVMTVPVAEHAKHAGVLSREFLKGKKFVCSYPGSLTATLEFDDHNAVFTFISYNHDGNYIDVSKGKYYISYNTVILIDDDGYVYDYTYIPELNAFRCGYYILYRE